jgi:3-hydroxyisobutyrate dehydrogenase-like beta-hydroxyacid dehydrogenase
MGAAIAANLVRAGHEVAVWNRSAGKAAGLVGLGAALAPTAKAAAIGRDAVFTMLADDGALDSVLSGPQGMSEGLRPGALHISMSTISVAAAERLSAQHADRGQHLLCAPAAGRPIWTAPGRCSRRSASGCFTSARPRPRRISSSSAATS